MFLVIISFTILELVELIFLFFTDWKRETSLHAFNSQLHSLFHSDWSIQWGVHTKLRKYSSCT